MGSVYDSFNLGNGYDNVYTAIPGAIGGGDTVTDTLVTPFGNVNLDSLFGSIDAAAPLQPGDAFTGLADSAVAHDAFTIGGYTLDPTLAAGGEGFDPVASTAGAAPLLNIGGVSLSDPAVAGDSIDTQGFTVYDGTGSNASDVGTITTGEDVTNLLGYTNTELVVTGSTAASGDTSSQAADLPATGTVLDAFNLGNGYRERLHRHSRRHCSRRHRHPWHRHRHPGDALRRHQPRLTVRQHQCRRPAQPGRRLHRARGGRQQHRRRCLQHRRHNLRPHADRPGHGPSVRSRRL